METEIIQDKKTGNLTNLLQQVSLIQKKYDDLAEYSGEHFNVFDILGVTSSELSHSAILTNLLDAKGKHGQKDLFLKLFITQIKNKFDEGSKKDLLTNFKTEASKAIAEKYTGLVDYNNQEGGRIDILISENNKNIIIENKIYAYDQPVQLIRYKNFDSKAPILYLTLDGKEPSDNSKGDMIEKDNFICISYKSDIKNWIENCIKETANKPIIRETLNQYVFLINSLTNQSNNYKMKEEFKQLMISHPKEVEIIIQNWNELQKDLKEKLGRIYNSIDIKLFDPIVDNVVFVAPPKSGENSDCFTLMFTVNNFSFSYEVDIDGLNFCSYYYSNNSQTEYKNQILEDNNIIGLNHDSNKDPQEIGSEITAEILKIISILK